MLTNLNHSTKNQCHETEPLNAHVAKGEKYATKLKRDRGLRRSPLISEKSDAMSEGALTPLATQPDETGVISPSRRVSPQFPNYLCDRRPSLRQLRHRELSQLLHDHRRGSFLSTASLALGVAPRPSRSSSGGDKDELIDQIGKPTHQLSLWRRTKQWAQYLYETSRFKYFLPLLILVGYSFLGGAIVYWIEAPIERWQLEGKQRFIDDQKFGLARTLWEIKENKSDRRRALTILRQSVYWYTITTLYMEGNFTRLPLPTVDVTSKVTTLRKYTEQMARRCWEIRLEISNQSEAQRKIEESLRLFEIFTGVSTELKPIWTFSNALFLAITIYTTIGYGSIAPHTVAGRVATIIYAVIGIPIYVMLIHKLGKVFLKLLHKIWTFFLRLARGWNCVRESKNWKRSMGKENSQIVNNIPVSLAVGVMFGWMFTCAGLCCLFIETSWDYFTSFYFFFISLTTIGFGDVTPTHPEYMFTMFGLIIVGLSLVSMCINVVQLKLELLFEEMMLAMMEEYEKTGQLIDGEIGVEPDFQRGFGLAQIFKLWKKKRATRRQSSEALAAGGLFLPLIAKQKRVAVLQELRRRSRSRTVATQTERWITERLVPTFGARIHREPEIERLHVATQTDSIFRSRSTSLMTCGSSAASENEKFHSDLSLYGYSHVGCRNRHSTRLQPDNSTDKKLEAPRRPWTSMDYASNCLSCNDKNDKTAPVSLRAQYRLQTPQPTSTRYFYRTSPISFAQHQHFDHGRYWLSGLRPEAPLGGAVPTMAIRRQTTEPSNDDFKILIKEIGCRLNECRHIITQQNEK